MSYCFDSEVIKQENVAKGYYLLTLSAPEAVMAAKPGQFLHVRCGNTLDPLLRRPISIHAVDREKGEMTLFYRVGGKGTALLSEKEEGESVNLLGPLGNGFTMPGNNENVYVVAGGIGIAPLYFLLQELDALKISATVFLGATTREQVFLTQEIKMLGHSVFAATDDGSIGHHGTVVELFDLYSRIPANGCGGKYEHSKELPIERVYGCGPVEMMKELSEILQQAGISGELSLEEKMGCGVGACLSCACKTRDGEDGFQYKRACVEGPVFPAGEVVWE